MNPSPVGSFPPSGIEVLIVGTGFGGLTAALECTRKGHNVRILERNTTVDKGGDMYFMGVSATGIFKHWPEMSEEYSGISLHDAWIETFKHDGNRMFPPTKVADRLRSPEGVNPGTFQMRPLIYTMLLEQVQRLGITIEFGKKVVDYFEDEQGGKGGVRLQDGTELKADVVIASDGVGSKSQKIVGGEVRARSSGRAMWRAVFPREHLDKYEDTKEFFAMKDGEEPIVRTFFGPGTYALTLTNKDVVVWIMNHDATGTEAESWHNHISADEVLNAMDKVPGPTKWSTAFQDLVRATPPDTIVNFELWWRDPQPSWSSKGGRIVQIGDAAHSFLPSSGNGATQAIEDATSLAACLQEGGKENIPEAVRAHVRFRFVRNACAQKMGFANAELLQKTDWEKVKFDPRKSSPKLPKWVWSHDPEAHVHQNYAACVDGMKKNIRIEDDERVPPNFPPGYRYEKWTIDDIMDDLNNGREVDLGAGDWN
ncbi:hypothetical protein MBLNU230_g8379t1 [Neophaeotheca triangularis]